ncbi:hypothetical protein AcV5_002331 [Taiwanofungus camphoratus]|nr:hypothetical protein AcV5_002331 [Antrodia cinnamomea]KAI0941868.1 hypothetical protein AcV7_002437 [Antrodia cinnamomea]
MTLDSCRTSIMPRIFDAHHSSWHIRALLLWSIPLLGYLTVPAVAAPVYPSVACYQDALIVWDMLVFFFTNFVAHAGSVPVRAEVGRFTRNVPLRRSTPWAAVIALFLPFAGLARAILLIGQHLRWGQDDVHTALVHGALLIVCRTSDWQPSVGRPELVYVKLPRNYHTLTEAEAASSYAKFEIDTDGYRSQRSHYQLDPDKCKLHGHMKFPRGYTLAAPANKYIIRGIISDTLQDTRQIKLYPQQSWPKVLLSIIQLISATFTLYRTRGDQIKRFGYAAYGFSVFPYALMTLTNMICVGVVGEYTCGYVLRTPILQEAERRSNEGALFDGAIGVLQDASPTESEYTAVKLQIEEEISAKTRLSQKTLIVEIGHSIKKFKFDPFADHYDTHSFGISSITHDGPPRNVKPSTRSWSERICLGLSFLLAMILPYTLIFVLTGFRKESSTVAERVWMLAWLCAGQLSSLITFVFYAIWRKLNNMIPTPVLYLSAVVLIIPAIGGFFMAGKMYLEDKGFQTGLCL